VTRSIGEVPMIPAEPLLDERYQLESLIGRGGMGTVYRALDTRLGRRVAVKLLVDTPAADEARFRAEVRMLARLSHPNLVRVLDTGESNGRLFLVMELIEGTTLEKRLRTGPLPPDDAAILGAEVSSALAYVHRQGIVHRDIKPANILLDREGVAHLADFGIARLVDTTGATTGMVLGTPAYLAPEQVQGGEIGPAVDIYALGLVLIETLTGERAFVGTPSEISAVRMQRPPDMPDGLDPEWRRTLAAMTALSAAERPTASSLRRHLANLPDAQATRPIALADQTELYPVADPTPPAVPVAPVAPVGAAPEPARASRQRPSLTAALIAVIAALVIALLLAATGLFSGAPPSRTGSGQTSTTLHSSTSVPRVGTTLPPTTTPPTTTSVTVASAAGQLVSVIESGVRDGTIQPQVGQQLVNGLNPVLFAQQPEPQQQEAQQLAAVAQMISHALSQSQITTGAGSSVTSALDRLVTALGMTPAAVTTTTAPPPPKHHGHGNGGGGDGGDGGGG
jgi:serine/threonine protein kinase